MASTSVGRYRKLPVEIEAIRWERGVNTEAVREFVGGTFTSDAEHLGSVGIRTLEGTMWANDGDWIIRGVQGEFYPCKPDIFDATYEEVS